MEKVDRINNFLKLLLEIKKNGILVDSNLVYSNLVGLNTTNESIEDYFPHYMALFKGKNNLEIYTDNNFFYLKSSDNKINIHDSIKIYIPLDKWHIYNGVKEIFEYINKSGIPHYSKITKRVRTDDITINVDSISNAEKIRNFINNNDYIKTGLLDINPFTYTDGNISYIWDGNLSYNVVLSNWLSDYINTTNDEVSFKKFISYVYKNYIEIFKNGKNINNFAKNNNIENYITELGDYKTITELLIVNLTNDNVKDFYNSYQSIVNKSKSGETDEYIRKVIDIDKPLINITPITKEAFDYAFVEMSKKESPKAALLRFKHFINNNDYKVFTQKNGIRELMYNVITRSALEELLYKEQEINLINACLQTLIKYDIIQVTKALLELKNGKYDGFTNENNARANLEMFVKPSELDGLIHKILLENGYDNVGKEEECWLFIELIRDLNNLREENKVLDSKV